MSTVSIQKKSITELRTDIIVNAANSRLAHGGGVCDAVFSAADPERLAEACNAIGYCAVGSAVITPAFALEETNGVRYIIHAVGPDYRHNPVDPDASLYSCYIAALTLAVEYDCHSIGFPLISAGIYDCPLHTAWDRALSACRDFLSSHPDYDLDIFFVSTSQVIADYGTYLLSDYETTTHADPVADCEQIRAKSSIPENRREPAIFFLQDLLDATDPNSYPETTAFLKRILREIDCLNAESVDRLINEVILCDCTMPLPNPVATWVKEHLKNANDTDGTATLMLGVLYFNGRIGKQDYSRAMDYYRRSASRGNLLALQNLGFCYYHGHSVPVDYGSAYHCFVKCALTGDLVALYKIGDMYRYGYYVDKDEKEAFRIYSQCNQNSAEDNHISCAANIAERMGDCYFSGIGCAKDPEQALMFYQQSERLYYRSLKCGDYTVKKSLQKVLKEEEQCRLALSKSLPDFEWISSKMDQSRRY